MITEQLVFASFFGMFSFYKMLILSLYHFVLVAMWLALSFCPLCDAIRVSLREAKTTVVEKRTEHWLNEFYQSPAAIFG